VVSFFEWGDFSVGSEVGILTHSKKHHVTAAVKRKKAGVVAGLPHMFQRIVS
jgi:hypothetical protein